jgi:outer membrane protein assembly factor BamB
MRPAQVLVSVLVAVLLTSTGRAYAAARPRASVNYPAIAVAGRSATVTGRVTHAGALRSLRVQLEQRVGSRWKALANVKVSKRGAFKLRWTIAGASSAATLRVRVVRAGRTVLKTPARRLVYSRPPPAAKSPAPGIVPGPTPSLLGHDVNPLPPADDTPAPNSTHPPVDVPSPDDVVSIPAPGEAGDVTISGATNVKPGDFLAIGVGNATPDGFFGQVTAVGTEGAARAGMRAATTRLTTKPAALTDAISDGDIDQTIDSAELSEAARAQMQARAAGDCKTAKGFELTPPTVTFIRSIAFKAHWSLFTLQSASLTGTATATLAMGAQANAGITCTLSSTVLRFKGKPITFTIGSVPVVLTPNASVVLDVDAAAQTTIQAGVTIPVSATAGIKWDRGSVSPIHSFEPPKFITTGPLVTGAASLGVSLTPKVDVLVYGVAGPELSFKAGLSLDANPTATPWWTLTAPVDLTAQLVAPSLKLSTDKLHVYTHTFDIAQATAPDGGSDGDASLHVGPYDYGTIEQGTSVTRQLTAGGGAQPYTFHLNMADTTRPPPWASITADGRLTVAVPPTDEDGYTFFVYVTDARGQHSPLTRDTITFRTGPIPAPQTNRPAVNLPTVPEALWTVPMGDAGAILPTASGNVLTTKCSWHNPADANVPFETQQVDAAGKLQWRRPGDDSDCTAIITDAAGNSYYFNSAAQNVRSVDATGHVRWTSAKLPGTIDRNGYSGPALGANGKVYFNLYDAYGHGYLTGIDETSGTIDVHRSVGFPIALFAYESGLIDVDGYGSVRYLNYDGSDHASYPLSSIYFAATGQLAATTGGTLYMSGGVENCSPTSGHFTVAKFTPAGVAWSWIAGASNGCERGSNAATPDGGVVVVETDPTSGAGHIESLDADGNLRWRKTTSPPTQPPMVDTMGTVAIPTPRQYTCPGGGSATCIGLQVAFSNAVTGATALPTVTATNPGHANGGGFRDVAIAPDRVYAGASPYLDNDTYKTDGDALAALAAPGIGRDYRLARQLEVAGPP